MSGEELCLELNSSKLLRLVCVSTPFPETSTSFRMEYLKALALASLATRLVNSIKNQTVFTRRNPFQSDSSLSGAGKAQRLISPLPPVQGNRLGAQ